MAQPQQQQDTRPRNADFKSTKEYQDYIKRQVEQQKDRRHNQW